MATTTRKAAPKSTPSSPNTSGAASAGRNIAISATSSAAPTNPSSGSTVFVNQAYAVQGHQSAATTSTPRPSPAKVGSSESSVATCVNANTKTRSKKSSRGVTLCSCSTAVATISATLVVGLAGCARLVVGLLRSAPSLPDLRDRSVEHDVGVLQGQLLRLR